MLPSMGAQRARHDLVTAHHHLNVCYSGRVEPLLPGPEALGIPGTRTERAGALGRGRSSSTQPPGVWEWGGIQGPASVWVGAGGDMTDAPLTLKVRAISDLNL